MGAAVIWPIGDPILGLALFVQFRTRADVGCAEGHGNQAFKRNPEASLAVPVLFEPERDFGLPVLQFARFLSYASDVILRAPTSLSRAA